MRIILDAPEASVSQEKSMISATEDSMVNITCKAEGNPAPEILWKEKGTGRLISTNGVLSLPNISKDQAGSYICQASNIIGASQAMEAVIDVKCECYHQLRICSKGFVPRWS